MKKLVLIALIVLSLVGGAGQASANPFDLGDGVSWEDGGLFGGMAPE